jgi:hypothetical protein
VQNIEDVIVRNLHVGGQGRIISEITGHQGYAVAFGSVFGYELDLRTRGTNLAAQTGGPYRVADFALDADIAFNIREEIILSGDKGCGDAVMRIRFVNTGTYPGVVHLHEGTFNVLVESPVIRNPPGSYSQHAIQILARSYDNVVNQADIDHDTSSAGAIYIADATCKRTKVINPRRLNNPNGITNAGTDTTIIGWGGATESYTPVTSQEMMLSCTIYYNSPQENVIGTIPAGSVVTNYMVQVLETFDGAAARIDLGKSLVNWSWFTSTAASLDISPGLSTDFVRTATTGYYQPSNAPVDVIYTADGSMTGKALVMVWYAPTVRVSGV